MNLRRVLPLELNGSLRRLLASGPRIAVDPENGRPRIWFLDAPDYGNSGDLAIREAMIQFIEKNKDPACRLLVLDQRGIPASIRKVRKAISARDVICLAGGGNMGVDYPRYEANRRMIIKAFPGNRIVIFPSTIDYAGGRYARREFNRAVKVYARHNDLHIFARERASYATLAEHFRNPVYLCPDMAMALQVVVKPAVREGIGICLRRDAESALTGNERDAVVALAGQMCPSSKTLDTMIAQDVLARDPGKKIVDDKIGEFAACRLVITDRLHGMIFSYLAGTPCIAFDNRNRKVSGVYEWIKSCGFVVLSARVDECRDFIEDALNGTVTRCGDGRAAVVQAGFAQLAACIAKVR